MDTIEKRLKTNGADPRILFGFGDSHLLYLEQRFDVTIVGRGDTIIVRGRKEDVDTIERILKEMKYIAQKTGTLSEKDVQTVVDLIASGKNMEMPPEEVDSIVLYTKGGYIKARTPGQLAFLKAARTHDIVFAIGPAGTGKTYMAVALALAALRNHEVGKIVLARPAVEAGERLGYLPGDLQEKVDPYLRPLYDALEDMLPPDKLRAYLERRIIEIVPLAYMRGRTLNNAFIII
ncbi:MAG: ATP-binding protein [Chlorobi bacterium]|nr:ATP-binding protein [Chlorobiota bacterium]